MITLEAALADTSYNLELEKIKNKIAQLYKELLTKTFKQANPAASMEELYSFLEENELEFKETEEFDEEAEDIENILSLLSDKENLDPVKDKSFETPSVASGKTPGSKTNEKGMVPNTVALKDYKGGLFTPPDKKVKKVTKALKTPTGKVTRVIDDNPKVDTQMLKEVWDKERDKLLELVRQRNKEYGVVL
jgi:hypothetical protein